MRTNVNNDISKIYKHGGQFSSKGDQAEDSCHHTAHGWLPTLLFWYRRAVSGQLLDETCFFRDLGRYIGE